MSLAGNLTLPPFDTHPRHHSIALETSSTRDGSAIEQAVEQAIDSMRQDLWCPEGIRGIAADCFYSKFHFTREFSRITGTTARRYLAALRLQRAKELLTSSSFSVADASGLVGYESVGTFSTRFSQLVGMAPRTWRACNGAAVPLDEIHGPGTGVIRGKVSIGDIPGIHSDVFVGAFEDSIIQGTPLACVRLDGSGSFELRGLPEGQWSINAVVYAHHQDSTHVEELRAQARVASLPGPNTATLPVRLAPQATDAFSAPVVLEGTKALPQESPTRMSRRSI